MTLALLLQIISGVSELVDIAAKLKSAGLEPTDQVPAEHMDAINKALAPARRAPLGDPYAGE